MGRIHQDNVLTCQPKKRIAIEGELPCLQVPEQPGSLEVHKISHPQKASVSQGPLLEGLISATEPQHSEVRKPGFQWRNSDRHSTSDNHG